MKRKCILIVDDERHIVDVVEYILKENSFDTVAALNGDAGLRKFKDIEPDLAILDLNLPGMSGLDLFREMRALRPGVPVIMLTSRSEEVDRILGLELGADDYVTKPFSPRELAARVKAVLRRLDKPAGESRAALSFGPIEMDCDAFSLSCRERPITLTRSEFRLMECLVRYPAQVFTRDTLVSRIYDSEHVVTERSIDAYVKRLRKKFAEGKKGLDPIETVHSLGYKLNQRIEEE